MKSSNNYMNICGFGQEIENCFNTSCSYYSTLNSKCNYHQIKARLSIEKSLEKYNFHNSIIKKNKPIVRNNQSIELEDTAQIMAGGRNGIKTA